MYKIKKRSCVNTFATQKLGPQITDATFKKLIKEKEQILNDNKFLLEKNEKLNEKIETLTIEKEYCEQNSNNWFLLYDNLKKTKDDISKMETVKLYISPSETAMTIDNCNIVTQDSGPKTLISLPIGIGSSIFGFKKFLNKDWEIYESTVTGIYIDESGTKIQSTQCIDLPIEHINSKNNLFYSKEEAERALAELQSEN